MERIIDTGGYFQFITGYQEQTPTMLLEYTLNEPVDPEKLQAAAIMAADVFDLFKVKLTLNEKRQPVYQKNELPPAVYEDDGKPHALGNESRGYLFRILYTGCTIKLSIHHMLTDFFGANEFLKYILRCYLHQIDESISLSEDTIAADLHDLRDPYTLYGDIEAVGYHAMDQYANELIIPTTMLYRRCEPNPVRSLVFPVEKILLAAKKTDSSVFPLLSWLMANAAANTYGAEDKIVVGRGAANYRGLYNSKTPLCFSRAFKTVLLPRERDIDLETQLTVQRFRMDLKLDRRTTDQELAQSRVDREQMDGPIEAYVTDQEALYQDRKAGEKKSAFFISYPGKMDLPEDIGKYVDSCFFNTASTRGPLMAIAYSWRGKLCVNVSELACGKTIVPAMAAILKQYNVDSEYTNPCEIVYDYYPMEELLFSSNSVME